MKKRQNHTIKRSKKKEYINIISCIDSLKIYCNGYFKIKMKRNSI